MNLAQKLLQRVRAGERLYGAHTFFTDPQIGNAFAYLGYDFVWIDGEHAPFDKERLLMEVIAVNEGGSAAFVRVPWNDPVLIKPVLEMGVDGIILPMVETEEDAKRAVAACSYPPTGCRGYGPKRAAKYGIQPVQEYIKESSQSFLTIVQVETALGVSNIPKIAAVPGIDVIIIGPSDLSGSIGLLKQADHPDVQKIYDEAAALCCESGIAWGVSIKPDIATVREWEKRGAQIIGCADDLSFVVNSGREFLRKVTEENKEE